MLLKLDTQGEAPPEWIEYIAENPHTHMVGGDPRTVRLETVGTDIAGIVTALGRLNVSVEAVVVKPPYAYCTSAGN
jgi:hypothetical protein